MDFDLNEVLATFVDEVLDLETDGRFGEIIMDDGEMVMTGRPLKPLSTKFSRKTIQINFNIAVVVGMIAKRLSFMTFGVDNRFYRVKDTWCFYIEKDVFIESPREDKITWLSFVALIKVITKVDEKKITDKTAYDALYGLVYGKDANIQPLITFMEFVDKYKLSAKKHLERFFEKRVDTSIKEGEEIVLTKLPGGGTKRKIGDNTQIREAHKMNNASKILSPVRQQSMRDLAIGVLGKEYKFR